MSPLLFDLSSAPGMAASLCERLVWQRGELSQRHFPDGESYLRLLDPVAERDVAFLCTLDRPDPKIPPLLFAAATAREQGARSVGLIAPYLAYMRQDRAFQEGEAITSAIFAELISQRFDWLATVDPHLHRYPDLSRIYSVPAIAATASDAIARWIKSEIDRPVLIGPDEESGQWIEAIARRAGAHHVTLHKDRTGDLSVAVSGDRLTDVHGGTPVLADDIASSARTMIEAVRAVRESGLGPPVCVAIHAIFAGDGYDRLLAAGPVRIASTNTVSHATNVIDVSGALATAARDAMFRSSGVQR